VLALPSQFCSAALPVACLLYRSLQVQFFVLDEADRLMDKEDTIMKLFKRLPKAGAGLARLQVGLCVLRLLQGVKQLLCVLFTSQRRPGPTVG
jgi:hypothetical protein